MRPNIRAIARWALAGALATVSAFLIARMLWYLRWTLSNALRIDQWVMLEELWRFHDGRYGIGYLWQPYWGHRPVIPRLILMADEQWFGYSNKLLVALNLMAQGLSVAILSYLAWRLLARRGRWLAALAIAVTAQLLFSSLQLENFAYGMGMQYTLFLLFTVCGLVLMSRRRVVLALFCASAACLCFGSGLILFPVFAFQWMALRGRAARLWVVVAVWGAWVVAYSIGYANPGSGMGVLGIIRRPYGALRIAAVFLGGPLSNMSLGLGETAGALGIVATVYGAFRMWRKTDTSGLALLSLALFSVGAALTIAMGRISPDWLAAHATGPLPSRYLTMAFCFWSALFSATLSWSGSLADRVAFSCVTVVVLALTVGMAQRQLVESQAWFHYYRRMDAAAGGLIVGAGDQQWMSSMYPDQKLLDHWAQYLQAKKLSVFAEPRGEWMSSVLSGLATRRIRGCGGTIDRLTPVEHGAIRVEGHVNWPGISPWRKSDIVFTSSNGKVAGFARTLGETDGAGERFEGYLKEAALFVPYLMTGKGAACPFGSS